MDRLRNKMDNPWKRVMKKSISLMARPAKESARTRHKAFLVILSFLYALIFLLALYQHSKQEDVVQSFALQEEKVIVEAVFVEPFGKQHIEVKVKEKRKMYRYTNNLYDKVIQLKPNTAIEMELFKSKEGEWMIKTLTENKK